MVRTTETTTMHRMTIKKRKYMIDPNSTENQIDLVDFIEKQNKEGAEAKEKIQTILFQLKRFNEINQADIPVLIDFIEKSLGNL